jgi:hypothetical protein
MFFCFYHVDNNSVHVDVCTYSKRGINRKRTGRRDDTVLHDTNESR